MSADSTFEIRLVRSAPRTWGYVARRRGEVVAASDGGAPFENPGAALVACLKEYKAGLSGQGGGDGGR